MKILRVSQHLYPEVTGGLPYHVHAMSRDQAAMGHDVTVVTTRNDPSLPEQEQRDGYDIIRFSSLISPLGNDISIGFARYLKQVTDVDIIHAHSHLYFLTNIAALKSRFGHIPLAITNHGLYSQSAQTSLFKAYLHTLGRWTFNNADLIFCYTESEKEQLRKIGVSTETTVVQNGIDNERFKPQGPESPLLDDGDPRILFVGRLVPGKRPELVLDVLQELRKSEPEAALYICGDGPRRGALEQLASEMEIGDGVRFLGHVPFEEMPKIYRSADVLLLPSRDEGVPRTLLEAMATNVPVVLNYLEQLSDLDNEFNQQVNFSNSTEVTEAINNVLSESDWTSRGTITETFQWNQTVQHTTDHLVKVQQSATTSP